MLKKYISIFTISVAALFCANPAYADVIVDDINSTITLSGVADAKTNIGIEVFAPGKSYVDIDKMDLSEFKMVIPYVFQVTSNKDGEWKQSFKLSDSPSGKYTVYICEENAQTTRIENFIFVNIKEGQIALEKLFEAYPDENSVKSVIEEESENLGLGFDFMDKISVSKLSEIIISEIQNGEIKSDDFISAINGIRHSAVINAIDAGAADNLFDYSDILALDKSSISDFYKTSAVSKNYSEITAKLKNGNFTDFKSFEKKLTEKTVLSIVSNPDGVDDVKNILSAFSDEIGTKVKITDTICRKIMGKKYADYSELNKAINDSDAPSNGGGGGSSKGGSSSSLSGAFPVTSNPKSEVKPIEYDIFTDIGDVSWAKDAIVFLAQSGIIKGKSETEFYPNDNITREEIVTIISRAFCQDCDDAPIEFTDVANDSWYYSPIAKAVGCNIVNGYSDSLFGTGDNVSRQDMVTMVYRAAQYKGIAFDVKEIGFTDEADISDYAKEAVGALTNAEIVNGLDLYTFAPNQNATRAQVAKIIYKLVLLQ